MTLDEARKVMKRCQIGTRNYIQANDLHAECYGTIGALIGEIQRLRKAIKQTLDENSDLADGDVCTLILLKRAIGLSK